MLWLYRLGRRVAYALAAKAGAVMTETTQLPFVEERVTLGAKRYAVRFFSDNSIGVWCLFDKSPVNARGFYQADNSARRIDSFGETGNRVICAAADQMAARVKATGGAQ
jgi:hypothetical protein